MASPTPPPLPSTAPASLLHRGANLFLGIPYFSSPENPLPRATVICSVAPLPPTRRSASIALFTLLGSSTIFARGAAAGSPFNKYVKRKKLEPLETYVPPVLLTQEQLRDLEKSLDVEEPRFDASRSSLRSGPVSSLRVNIRAVAQYATDDGQGKAASDAVDKCLRALEELDSLLLHASRNDPSASVRTMKSNINTAILALDSLLQTVPPVVLDKGKAIADEYRKPSDESGETKLDDLDPELKQLQSIL